LKTIQGLRHLRGTAHNGAICGRAIAAKNGPRPDHCCVNPDRRNRGASPRGKSLLQGAQIGTQNEGDTQHMAGRPGKKPQQPAKPAFDEFGEETEGFEEDVSNVDAKGNPIPGNRSRDWRDVERYREVRELKKLIGEDFDPLFGSDRPAKRKKG